MLFKSILLSVFLLFTACGGGSSHDDNSKVESKSSIIDTNSENNTSSIKEKIEEKNLKYVTIYVHGYSKDGYKQKGVFGEINRDEIIDNLVEITDFATMDNFTKDDKQILAITPYYGDTSPSYYTQKDIEDLNKITKEYGGGIPRYATIIAKFAKHVLNQTKADKVNIVSASMGSLVTRWLIEKDVEHLASEKKIAKWLSIEGVIRGNYLASNPFLMMLASKVMSDSAETKQMSYDWINKNLDGVEATNENYKDIQMGFISSTYDKEHFLSKINNSPNDGVQLLKDTIFSKTPNHNPTYTIYHVDHIGIKYDKGAWAEVATFLQSSKRVKITLSTASISTLPSSKTEVIFENSVKSQKVEEIFGINDEISERLKAGKALKKITYQNPDIKKEVNQVIFNDFVLEDGNELSIKITPYTDKKLDTVELNVELKNSQVDVHGADWEGTIKVELL